MRTKIFIYGVCIFTIILFQSTIADNISLYGIKPNLMIVFIISVALVRGAYEGATIGIIMGLVQDIMTGRVLGFYALLGFYLGLVIGSVNRRLYRENFIVIIIFTFVSSIAYESSVYFLGLFFLGKPNIPKVYSSIIMPETLYNIVVSLFVYIFMIKLGDRFEEIDKNTRRY